MKFLSIYKTVERSTPPSAEEMATMGKLVEDGFKAGWLLATEGCLPTKLGARVRKSGSDITVTDGPFSESKEVVGGFAILKADSKAEAIELARTFLKVAGEGECELRQIYEQDSAERNCTSHRDEFMEAVAVALKA
ncbi:MAG TPA: YciI family protein [Candidatus Sulfotelmatobacter sp.]